MGRDKRVVDWLRFAKLPPMEMRELEDAAQLIYSALQPTAQICWPLLCQRAGCEVWVKHENHNPTGAFKVRGGLVYLDDLKRRKPGIRGVITATRGNHGQSIAFAGKRLGIPVVIVAPEGNSREKNAAMRAFGAELIETGRDFDEARSALARLAQERELEIVPSYHPLLVRGVATYAVEFFRNAPKLDEVYAPIGLGSGISGIVAARDLLGLKTRVIGVVASGAPAYALSFAAGEVVKTQNAVTMADGVACRVPDASAVEIIRHGVERVVQVSEEEIAGAMRAYFSDTHNVAEGAAATALAALLKEREHMRGKRAGLILTGSNVDRDVFARLIGHAD